MQRFLYLLLFIGINNFVLSNKERIAIFEKTYPSLGKLQYMGLRFYEQFEQETTESGRINVISEVLNTQEEKSFEVIDNIVRELGLFISNSKHIDQTEKDALVNWLSKFNKNFFQSLTQISSNITDNITQTECLDLQ